eukprot:2223425-Pyramimonas_sp.AAC.1
MRRFRVAAASFIKAAKCVYEINIQDEIDELNTYSAAWNELADAIVGQILNWDPNFVRTPIVAERT